MTEELESRVSALANLIPLMSDESWCDTNNLGRLHDAHITPSERHTKSKNMCTSIHPRDLARDARETARDRIETRETACATLAKDRETAAKDRETAAIDEK